MSDLTYCLICAEPNITKTYEAFPLGVMGYVCEECDKKYVSVVREAKAKIEKWEHLRIATQLESRRRRWEEEKALAVVQEEDRVKAKYRAMKVKKPVVAKSVEEKEESAPKPAEKPKHIHYRRYLGGDRDVGEIRMPFETRDVPVEEVKVGDVIVVSEAWECEDVEIIWKVCRLNKKTISLYACDETGTPTKEKEKRLMDKRGGAFRVVKPKWDDDA
jgi:transposase-like protein